MNQASDTNSRPVGDRPLKVAYLTAGAAGMFCGSCMHDNTLVAALTRLGEDVQLIPTYTPIRTDEADVSVDQVFFGGINIYLQQKIPFFRYLPRFVDRFLDSKWLIRKVTAKSVDMKMSELGALTVSMLKGKEGYQRKEVDRLCDWLQQEVKPDIIVFTNALIGGCIPELKKRMKVPVIVTLQGDDIFLDSLPEPYRADSIREISRIAKAVDGFLSHSEFYADSMSAMLSLDRKRVQVIPLGIDTREFLSLPNRESAIGDTASNHEVKIGYLARLAPEKGFHQLVDAFIRLREDKAMSHVKLTAAGWLAPQKQPYLDEQLSKLDRAGLRSEFHYAGSISREAKIEFLRGLDIFSVPTTYREPKGLFLLEAMSVGLPVVEPAHGAFPEVLADVEGGLLFEAGNIEDLVAKLKSLVSDRSLRKALGQTARTNVLKRRNEVVMAERTANYLRSMVS